MKITLKRNKTVKETTVGTLSIDDVFTCYTIEDAVRDKKVYGQTAIPPGTYKVVITMSPRFKKPLALLMNVPGYEGIRIHAGNTHKNTDGCILPVTSVSADQQFGYESGKALKKVQPKIQAALDRGETVTIEITNG